MLGALVAAIAVTADVATDGLLTRLDHRIAERMFAWNLRDSTIAKIPLTLLLYFGQRGVVLSGSVLLAAWLVWRVRTLEPLVRLVVALALILAVIYAFKLGLGRLAPRGEQLGERAGSGASYPSGHVTNAIVLWGLADWSVRRWPEAFVPALARAVRVGRWLAPFAVTIAMILLNYHWLSDFLGGAAIAVVLLAVALWPGWTAASRPFERRLGLRPSAAR